MSLRAMAGLGALGLVAWFGWASQQATKAPRGGPEYVGPTPTDIPSVTMAAYVQAALNSPPECQMSWPVLAGFGAIESGHGTYRGDGITRSISADGTISPPIIGPQLDGQEFALIWDTDGGSYDGDTTYDRAVGATQFLPATWDAYAPGEDPQNVFAAARATSRKVCNDAGGAVTDSANLTEAAYRYNPDSDYVRAVIERADEYTAFAATNGTGTIESSRDSITAPVPTVDEPTLATIARIMGQSGRRQWGSVGHLLASDGPSGYFDRTYGLLDPAVQAVMNTLDRPDAKLPTPNTHISPAARSFSFVLPAGTITKGLVSGPHHDYPADDIPVDEGTPVLAPEGGHVVVIANDSCGNGVAISGGSGFSWLLCHLQRATVASGGEVRAGEQVGLSGNTGHSTGPHLHVELHAPGGALVCPQPSLLGWMDGGQDPPSTANGTDCHT